MKIMTTLLVGVLAVGVAGRSMPDAQQPGEPKQVVIVVVGAGGTPQYTSQFAEWAGLWERACSK